MAFGSRKLEVEITGDSRSLERAFQRSSRAGKQWSNEMAQVMGGGRGGRLGGLALARGGPIAGGVLAAGAGFAKTTQLASNLNEEMSRSRVVFGDSAEAVQAWSRTTAKGFGIAQTEALAAADNFGTLFATIGIGQDESAGMSRRLTELAADMASFNNEDPTAMLDRLRSGLAGEAEPLRRFGVLLSEARVKTEAYATGIARAGSKLTEQQKVAARYALILKDTSIQQGDFARTSDSLANQQRILKAEVSDLATNIGTKLLPVMTGIVSLANDGVGALDRLGGAMQRASSDAEGASGWFGALKDAIKGVVDLQGFRGIGGGFRAAAAGGPSPPPGIFETGPTGVAGASKMLADLAKANKAAAFRANASQRNKWFDAKIARELLRLEGLSTQQQIARLRIIAQEIRARLAITKDLTRQLNLKDDIFQIDQQILGLQQAQAAAGKASAEAAKAAAEAAREAARERKETQLFGLLGLGPGGQALAPGVAALRRRFAKTADAVRGTRLEAKFRSKMRGIAKALTDPLLKAFPEVRRAIEAELAKIDAAVGKQGKRRRTFVAPDVDAMLRGLGLSPEQMRALKARIAGGTVAGATAGTGGRAAFGMPLGGATVVNVYGDVVTPDPDAFARKMQKRAKRSRAQQRGVRPGVNQGLA